jgi:hypothetical protein
LVLKTETDCVLCEIQAEAREETDELNIRIEFFGYKSSVYEISTFMRYKL